LKPHTVIFGGSGGQPYPTSAADIKAWLTDHYFEHVPHVAELLQGWRAAAAASPGKSSAEIHLGEPE